VLTGKAVIKPFVAAFDDYWNNATPATFGATPSAQQARLGLVQIYGATAGAERAPPGSCRDLGPLSAVA
jgi:hypothetical protein